MRIPSRVVAIPLCLELRLFSSSDQTYTVEDLNAKALQDLLPHAESMQLHWLLDDVSTSEIVWNILAYPGWDRDHELSSVLFFGSDQTTAGPGLSAITNFSASSHYMKHCHLQLRWHLFGGVTTPKEGRFSAILYVTTKGQ